MAFHEKLLAVAKTKGKDPSAVTMNDLVQSGIDPSTASGMLSEAAGSLPSTPVSNTIGPTQSSQALAADVLSGSLKSGLVTTGQVNQNAATSGVNMSNAFGSNPVSGLYTPTLPSATNSKPAVASSQPSGQASQPAQASTGQIGPASRPVSPAVQALLDMFKERMNAAPMTSDQIVNSPEYQAQKRVIDLNRAQSRNALEQRLSSQGIMRSTPAVQALAGSDAYYTGQEDSLVPQMLTAATARQRQSILDAKALLDAQTGVENTAFDQGITQFNTAAPYNYLTKTQETEATGKYNNEYTQKGRENEAAMTGIDPVTRLPSYAAAKDQATYTGKFLSPSAQSAIQTVLEAKRNYAGDPTGGKAKADAARALLPALGIDPSLFGADVTHDQAVKNAASVGWTQAGRANEAALGGKDPVTGIETPDAKYKRLQTEREQLLIDNQRLENEVKSNPDYGLRAQAVFQLKENDKNLEKLDADIASTRALTNQRNTPAAPKKSDEEVSAEKERSAQVEDYVSQYRITRGGASAWEDFNDIVSAGKADGSAYTPEEERAVVSKIQDKLTKQDSDWLFAMWRSMNGDASWAADLEGPKFNRKPATTTNDGTGALK